MPDNPLRGRKMALDFDERRLKRMIDSGKADEVVDKAPAERMAERQLKNAFLGLLKAGMTVTAACQTSGITRNRVDLWIKAKPEFQYEIEACRRSGRHQRKMDAEDHLYEAVQGDRDRNSVISAMFLLKSYEPETYNEMAQVKRLTDSQGKPIEVVIEGSWTTEQKALPEGGE